MLSNIKIEIIQAVLKDFSELLNNVQLEDIFSVALTTVEDFSSIRLCVGRISYIQKFGLSKEFHSFEYFSGHVWNPDEWDTFSDNLQSSEIDKVNKFIGENIDAIDKSILSDCYLGALQSITCLSDTFKFISITDNDEDFEDYSSKILNPNNLHKLFLQRYSYPFDFYPPIRIVSKKPRIIP